MQAHHRRLIVLVIITAAVAAVWITAMIGIITTVQPPPAGDYVRVEQSNATAGWMALVLASAVGAMVCFVGIAQESQRLMTRRLLGRHPPDEPH